MSDWLFALGTLVTVGEDNKHKDRTWAVVALTGWVSVKSGVKVDIKR